MPDESGPKSSAKSVDYERQLRLLQTQREYAFCDIQILYDLSSKIQSDKSAATQFKSRFKRIDILRNEYIDYCTQINELKLKINPSDTVDLKLVEAFDVLYYIVIGVADSELSAAAAAARAQQAAGSAGGGASGSAEFSYHSFQSSKPCSQARLPKLELPKFDGNIEHWQTFFDTFSSLVHENKNITSIEKFHYLLSCLSSSALSIAKGIPVTGDNYQIVFDALIERFQNKRILASTYLDKISNFSPLKSGNYQELRNLTNILNETVNALKAMKIEQLEEFILFYLVSRVLDADTRKRFEIQNQKQIPTFTELLSFLQGYVKVLEASQSGKVPSSGTQLKQFNKNLSRTTETRNKINNNYKSASLPSTTADVLPTPQKPADCFCCGESHGIFKCSKFQQLNIPDKYKLVSKQNLCGNCLRPNHNVNKCFSKSSCLTCGKRHHSLLHDDGSTVAIASSSVELTEGEEVSSETVPPTVNVTSTAASTHVGRGRALVLLGTCIVRVRGQGSAAPPTLVRALIDSGAQDCFMTTSLAQRLGLPIRRCNLAVAGLGQNVVHQVKGETSCTVQSRDSDTPRFDINAIVMNTITGKMPTVEISNTVRANYKHLVLADSEFDKPSEIDLLLGAELFHKIYDGQRLEVGPGLPVALHSIFGWVLTGRVDPVCCPPPMVSSLVASTRSLEDVVKRFWEVEEPPKVVVSNPEDIKCEDLYSTLVTRKPDGRYVVPLLLKDTSESLGDSFENAKSRFFKLEKRLNRNEALKRDYCDFMIEYEDLGHMQPSSLRSGKYIIPHHCVIRPESSTTKLRVVFDASAKTTTGNSLNDIVYTGPKLQNDIVDILTKFRLHSIVFTSDISKMYRNIDLRAEDRVWQHVLWRNSPSDPVFEYELNTVTYGVTSSPYLAIRTLHQLAVDHGSSYPEAANVIRNDTFMDDITAGASSVEQALHLKDELIQLLKCAQFELRKWSSNSTEFIKALPADHCQVPKSFCDENHQHVLKILGIQWDPVGDFFTYSVSDLNSHFTKRAILSNVARIYDPVGWLAPVILVAKLLLQDLWRLNLGWDDPVPSDVAHRWSNFAAELQNIKNIKLPRRVTSSDTDTYYQLIGFSDGSSKAYGCCVYVRSVSANSCMAHLLIAKSKVAPIKPLTVNRLELCGAVLLARVLKHMFNLLRKKIPISKMIAFTDSSTVLSWLHTEPHKLKTFVAHRVVKITDEVPVENWQHVSTHDNPADHCSRGLSGSELAQCTSWWSGPNWLSSDSSLWPVKCDWESLPSVPELRTNAHLSQTTTEPVETETDFVSNLLKRYSTLSRVQRIFAWCLRVKMRFKRSVGSRERSVLSTKELEQSLLLMVQHEQKLYFTKEVQASKAIQKLHPFVDDADLLRVGGRLTNSHLPIASKHPLLLPKASLLSILIIDHFHVTYLHCGPRTLQSIIQRRFWILGIRNLIRSRLSKCIPCFKARPIACQPVMGDLPSSRVQPSRCFQKVGIDFAGAFMVKESQRRKAPTYKAYVCVFVCLTVKAIHLEVVTELSTPGFMAALDCFVSRRGLCTLIVSDNGTNFVGAKRYLNELEKLVRDNQDSLISNLAKRQIIWQLNPPTGSHFGGIFESGVKSLKYHLKRVVGSQILTIEELMTVLTKVEAVLNSRPLCCISSDPGEVDILTPGHFLVNGPLVALPEPEMVDEYVPPRARWRMLQKLTQSFWRIWKNDYLHTLQQRAKWFQGQANVQVGDIVLIVDNNLPPLDWRSGRIITLHPGQDNVVRVVTVRTTNGLLKRPVTKLCPLPINN